MQYFTGLVSNVLYQQFVGLQFIYVDAPLKILLVHAEYVHNLKQYCYLPFALIESILQVEKFNPHTMQIKITQT